MDFEGIKKIQSRHIMEDASIEKSKASSEETLSCGDVSSFKSMEGRDVSSLEILDDQCDDRSLREDPSVPEAREPPTLFHPTSHISAFSVYNGVDALEIAPTHPTTAPMQGPIVQTSINNSGIFKYLGGVFCERMVPHRCGYSCCEAQIGGNYVNSLLGPEFVEYLEESAFPSYELAEVATQVSNLAWLRSGLENTSVKAMCDAAGAVLRNDSTVQMGNPSGKIVSNGSHVHMGQTQEKRLNDHFRIDEGKNKLTGINV